MAHWNSDQVVGGIEEPRFLIVGPELSPNISFEDGLSGVSGGPPPAAPYSQLFDTTTPFMDYVLKIDDNVTTDQQYAEITIETGETIAEKRFIVFAYIRNDADNADQPVWCVFQGISGTHEKQYMVDDTWRRTIVHEIVVPADATGTQLVYRIYPTGKSEGSSGIGAVRIDNFRCRKILAEYTLPIPDRKKQSEFFRLLKQAEHELIDGTLKTYKKGYRYYYESGYDKLSAVNEYVRGVLAETDDEILFFPHKDASNCYLVKWADDLERRWAFGTAALGHEADVQVIGQEVVHGIAGEIIDAMNSYSYETDSYTGGGSAPI